MGALGRLGTEVYMTAQSKSFDVFDMYSSLLCVHPPIEQYSLYRTTEAFALDRDQFSRNDQKYRDLNTFATAAQ